MSAYIIFIREKTTDPAELATYSAQVGETLKGHPIKGLAHYGKHEDLEGSPTESAVIAEFPTMAEAKAWYDGDEYRRVREHRFKGAEYRVLLVEGI